jgi:hypothetical protein
MGEVSQGSDYYGSKEAIIPREKIEDTRENDVGCFSK